MYSWSLRTRLDSVHVISLSRGWHIETNNYSRSHLHLLAIQRSQLTYPQFACFEIVRGSRGTHPVTGRTCKDPDLAGNLTQSLPAVWKSICSNCAFKVLWLYSRYIICTFTDASTSEQNTVYEFDRWLENFCFGDNIVRFYVEFEWQYYSFYLYNFLWAFVSFCNVNMWTSASIRNTHPLHLHDHHVSAQSHTVI